MCANEGDVLWCEKILAALDDRRYLFMRADIGDLDDAVSLFEDEKYVIGTRFHSIIMAIDADCILYPIIYEAKSENFLKDIKYDGLTSHIENPEAFNADEVIKELQRGYIFDAKQIKHDAAEQFSVLSKCLNNTENIS